MTSRAPAGRPAAPAKDRTAATSRAPAKRQTLNTPELDRRIADAKARTLVGWRGRRLHLDALREEIAHYDDRGARDRAYTAYIEALDVLNPFYVERLRAWQRAGDVVALTAKAGTDPAAFAVDLERFGFNVETPYYAALRRYLALLDIEQGDATEADLWHITRGVSWAQWFGKRQAATALQATGRTSTGGELDGWRSSEAALRGQGGSEAATVVGAAFASLVGAPAWLESELGMSREELAAFVDFAAFIRLMRLRRDHAELLYELRLYETDDEALQRAYFSGIVGHLTGVGVAEGGYLAGIERPFASVKRLETELAGTMLAEGLEGRYGARWWRDAEAISTTRRLADAASVGDVLAELGYDGTDWRPVLRQIRTRLIGEMSGYGGPNITTRAGTRKV